MQVNIPDHDLSVNDIYPSGFSHSFDTGIACEFGIESAIIYNHIHYWLSHNKIRGKNQHEGRTWTYDSSESMSHHMPYLTPKQIQIAMKRLVDNGIVIKSNFNEDKFDKTPWYALNDESTLCHSKKTYDATKSAHRNENLKDEIKESSTMRRNRRVDTTFSARPLYTTYTKPTDTNNIEPLPTLSSDESADASSERFSSSPCNPKQKKETIPTHPNLEEVADAFIQTVVDLDPDRPPLKKTAAFKASINEMLVTDRIPKDLMLNVLEWGLQDNVIQDNGWSGWSSKLLAYEKKNMAGYFRGKFRTIECSMKAKHVKKQGKFCAGSDDDKALAIIKEMRSRAI